MTQVLASEAIEALPLGPLPWLLAFGSLAFLGSFLVTAWRGRHSIWLDDLNPPEPKKWPTLSVIFAARDEQDSVERTCRGLFQQDYPGLRVVAVDDRSRDETGPILDRIATELDGLEVRHVEQLPEAWLGKPHALNEGLRGAESDWILLTDADVNMRPGTLKRAVAWAEAKGLDHFTVSPYMEETTFLLASTTWIFGTGMMLHLDVGRDGVVGPDSCIGVGAFNLVRRSLLVEHSAMEWLRMEIGDDLAVGQLVQSVGGRSGFALSRGMLHMVWYRDVPELMRGLEKNVFAVVGRFQVWRALLLASACFFVGASPVAILLLPAWRLFGLGCWLLYGLLSMVAARRAALPTLPPLFAPIGFLIIGATILRSTWHALRHGGIVWRDTRYPLAGLREGQRVRF